MNTCRHARHSGSADGRNMNAVAMSRPHGGHMLTGTARGVPSGAKHTTDPMRRRGLDHTSAVHARGAACGRMRVIGHHFRSIGSLVLLGAAPHPVASMSNPATSRLTPSIVPAKSATS